MSENKKEEQQKPQCPECDTELILVNGKLPEECAKCGFDLSGFEIFQRMYNVVKKKETPKPEPIAEPRKKGLAGVFSKKKVK